MLDVVLVKVNCAEYLAFFEALGQLLEAAPTRASRALLDSHVMNYPPWRGVIGRNNTPDLNPNGGLLLGISVCDTRVCWECWVEPLATPPGEL